MTPDAQMPADLASMVTYLRQYNAGSAGVVTEKRR